MRYRELDHYVEWLQAFPRQAVAEYLSLKRVELLLRLLGSPERRLKGFQVAGTNGKGSTVMLLEAGLRGAGYRVGAFLSPHLVSYTERFRINGREVSQTRLAELVTRVSQKVGEAERRIHDRPTWFEVLTAVAALYFAEEKVDWAVFEVGLGGRLDATTALGLRYKVITDIGRDHAHILGSTIKKIAGEKAGIIQARSVVISSNSGMAQKMIRSRCLQVGARLIPFPRTQHLNVSLEGTSFRIDDESRRYQAFIPLVGRQQPRNAALAFGMLREIAQIPAEAILRSFRAVQFPGRFTIVPRSPLTVLDGAHNLPAIARLIRTLDDLRVNNKRLIIIYAAKERKEYRPIIRRLATRCRLIIFPETHLHGMVDPKILRRIHTAAYVTSSIAAALKKAKTAAGKNDMILVTGSLYLVGAVLRQMKHMRSATVDKIDDNRVELLSPR
ncbi:MAG: Mur ligase family protein [bacterium]|nr:Mur ligase family protein [bacterium]